MYIINSIINNLSYFYKFDLDYIDINGDIHRFYKLNNNYICDNNLVYQNLINKGYSNVYLLTFSPNLFLDLKDNYNCIFIPYYFYPMKTIQYETINIPIILQKDAVLLYFYSDYENIFNYYNNLFDELVVNFKLQRDTKRFRDMVNYFKNCSFNVIEGSILSNKVILAYNPNINSTFKTTFYHYLNILYKFQKIYFYIEKNSYYFKDFLFLKDLGISINIEDYNDNLSTFIIKHYIYDINDIFFKSIRNCMENLFYFENCNDLEDIKRLILNG